MKIALFGMCAALLAALAIDASAANEDVVQMIKNFYKWYVPQLDQKPGSKSDHKMSEFVTERLVNQVARLQKFEDGGVPKLDWDPYVNAQDYEADWATRIDVSDVKAKGDNATATVRLGGKDGSTVRLVLIRSGRRWKIDNFVPKL